MFHPDATTRRRFGTRAVRAVGQAALFLVLAAACAHVSAVVASAGPQSAGSAVVQEHRAAEAPPPSASVVKVLARDGSGNLIARGVGFFVEIGRLVIPRGLLLDRAHSAAVLYGKNEQPVTAVLADDPRAGLALVAVDLPDGAPPAIATRLSNAAVAAGQYHALDPEAAHPVAISAQVDVPGVGPVCPVTASDPAPSVGTPIVDNGGTLVGVLVERTAGTEHLTFVLPAARALALSPVGPLAVSEWRLRAQAAGTGQGDAAFLRGARAWLEGRREDAAASFRTAAVSSPDADVQAALGAAEIAAGHVDAGVASYRAAITADPTNPRLHHDLGLALADTERWNEAAAEFAEVARLRPRDAEAQFNLGSAYGKLGRLDAEYTAYQSALRENPAHLKALRNLGIVCIALKRYAEAVAVSAKALRFVPTDAPLHAQLGVAYFDLGNAGSAIEELKKAVELEPGFVKAHYGLALVYAASGQHAAAISECETLKRLDPARGAEVSRIVER